MLNELCGVQVVCLCKMKSWAGCTRIKPVLLVAVGISLLTFETMKQSRNQGSENTAASWGLKGWKRQHWVPFNSSGLKTINTRSYCDVQAVSAEWVCTVGTTPAAAALQSWNTLLAKEFFFFFNYYFLSFENSSVSCVPHHHLLYPQLQFSLCPTTHPLAAALKEHRPNLSNFQQGHRVVGKVPAASFSELQKAGSSASSAAVNNV